jgi:hypothetical protein
MVKLILEYSYPVLFLVSFYVLFVIWDLRRPVARALGCILSNLCVVSYEEIWRYCKLLEQEDRVSGHLWREIRRKKVFVIAQYVRLMMLNTRLFQQASLFEKRKIDPRKSGLEYDMRETLVASLVEDSAAVRWQLYKSQISLLVRAVLRLDANHQLLMNLLGVYKKLEEDIVALAGMAEDTCYRDMLLERLGLMSWGLVNGGGSEPNPA